MCVVEKGDFLMQVAATRLLFFFFFFETWQTEVACMVLSQNDFSLALFFAECLTDTDGDWLVIDVGP